MRMHQLIVCIAALAGLQFRTAWADAPWPLSLSYDGEGYWSVRVPVEISYRGAASLQGVPLRLPVSTDDGTAALVGQAVAGLRVAGANGVEYVFGVDGSNGAPKREGAIAVGDVITIPVETVDAGIDGVVKIETADADTPAAAGTATGKAPARDETIVVYAYAGNDDAWLPPEWLGGALRNLDFEDDEKGATVPPGWVVTAVDEQHRMSWQQDGARSGRRCARCEVDEGAEPTWVKYTQGGVPVRPGQTYRFTAWVKANDVKGKAGWYIHVDGERSQMVNRSDTVGGTYDWRHASMEFEIPAGANVLSCGTLLHGTGTAWFDDAKLELLGSQDSLIPRVGAAERRQLARRGHDAAWRAAEHWAWRAPIVVRNFAAQPMVRTLVAVDVRRLANRFRKLLGFGVVPQLRLVDPAHPDQALTVAGDTVDGLFAMANVSPRTAQTFWLYVSAKQKVTDASPGIELAHWASSEASLASNGTMEEATDGRATAWHAGEEGNEAERRFTAKRVAKGIGGGWCLELDVPKTLETPGWTGWRQMVPVKPGMRYLLSGYIKTQGVDGQVKIHGHFRKQDRTHTASPFFGTTTGISGDTDWTRTAVAVTTPPDCAFIEIHLTMNARGALWHDNVSLLQTGRGCVGELESRRSVTRDLDAWAVNPLVKVFREDVAPHQPRRSLDVYAYRNSWRAGQITLRAAVARDVRLRVTPLRSDAGATLPAPTLYKVGFVPMDFPMGYASSKAPAYHRLLPRSPGCDGWPGWWPDPMIPFERDAAVRLEADSAQPIWVDVHVPAGAAPGVYRGRIEVSGGRSNVQLPLTVTVWDLVMPLERHLPAIYDLRRGRGRDPFAGAEVATWYRFLARYNVSPGFVIATPTFTYENGQVTMATDEFDEQARLVFDELKVSKVYTPNRWFYACGWAYPPKRIFGLEPFTPAYVKAWSDAYRLFIEHLTANGWRDNFVHYISDEPHKTSDVTITGIARLAGMAREVAPDVLVYSSTWRYIEGLAGHLTLWGMGPQGSFDPEKHEERRQAGDRFWYTTDGQMCTDTPYLGIERLLPWFCFKYGCEAYEFWGVSWWTYNPWERGWHTFIRQSSDGKEYRWVRYPNGDGFLAYPGEDLGLSEPVPSIRLVAAREGVDDYELLLALDEYARNGNAQAAAALERMKALVTMPNRGGRYSTDVMPDPDAVMQAHIAAGELLNRLRRGQ